MGRSTCERIAFAARRFLEHGGSEAVTMRRVAQAVGVTPMALYRHFPDRATLLNALANEGFQELAARLEGVQASRNIEERLLRMFDV